MKVKGKKILLVEDNKIIQFACRLILEEFFQRVDIASTGQELMALQEEKPYDLIFMDISLPDGFGYDFAKKIKEKNSGTMILALTAHDDTETRNHCALAGMEDYIVKPLEAKKVKEIADLF